MEKIWLNSYEKGVPHKIDYPNVPLTNFLTKTAEKFPNNNAIVFFGSKLTFKELNELTDVFAKAFIEEFKLQKGDRVALFLPNLPQTVIAFYGILKTGAVVVQVNPLYTEKELEYQLIDSGAKIIISLDVLYNKVEKVKDNTPLKHIVVTRVQDFLPPILKLLYPIKAKLEKHWVNIVCKPPLFDFLSLIKENADIKLPVISPDDLALLQYTGGTTGVSKGVMLTHRNLVANTYQVKCLMTDFKDGKEIILGVIPFFHVYGMTVCMNLAMLGGSTMVLLPRFLVKDVLKTIDKFKPSIFPGVPLMYSAINNYPDVKRYDLSSIRACISGAGALLESVQTKFESLTGGRLVEGFGLTEASPVTHCIPVYGKREIGSVGLPIPDTDVKIVDIESGEKELGIGEVGELCVKGPQVMKGYWNKEEETTKTLRNGWLYTGDIARVDSNGFFYIVDRKKEMIKTKGENVYPREIEEILAKHPKLKEGAVIGIPDEQFGEKIKAFVVVKEGEQPTKEEIIDFCKQNLAKFKIPHEIEFRKELPKTIIGKILRRVLLEEELKKK